MGEQGEESAGDIEGDDASDERDLLGERRPTAVGLVATEMGVLRVELAPDRIGGFGLVERCTATAIATDGAVVVVGTDEDILADETGTGEFTPLGFGPATAVGLTSGWLFAASPGGQVGRLPRDAVGDEPAEWEPVGDTTGPRRFDGHHLATDDGVVRIEDGISNLGSTDVLDVSCGRVNDELVLFAATRDGLFRRDGSDWVRELATPVQRVSVGDGTAVAISVRGELYRRDDGDWTAVSLPENRVAFDVASAESLYVVTEDGEMMIAAAPTATTDGFGGWHTQPLGVRGVSGMVLLHE